MLLKTLPPDARPREKLLARGARALSDAELLALLLRTGMQGKNVIALAQEIVSKFGGIAGLLHASPEAMKDIKGLGPAKRAELQAVLELSRRALAQQMQEKPVLQTPSALLDFVRLQIGAKPYEVFAVLFLDTHQRLIAWEELFRGTLTQTSVYPREVALRALHWQAHSVVLAHNHPSGQVEPSHADHSLTSKLKAALALLDIQVMDHVIVSPSQSLSMLSEGVF
ncbi:MAG: DNA repair protein RadC [Brachymonas sp.]|nr:DNA repair protein RadC [Brachymonas sp.]